MMKKKKKQSRSQSSSKKTSPDSSPLPSPRLLSLFRSKSKDLKHMLGMKSKTVPGLSSQSRIVRCPKCKKLLQEPIDATCYKCGGCDSILQAKRWELQGNDNTIPEALLASENRSLSTEVESADGGSKTPVRNTHWENNSRESHTHRENSSSAPRPSHTHSEYNSRAPPSVERDYVSETVYKHATSDIRREWVRRANEFSVNDDSDVYASERNSPYNSRSHNSEWTQHEGRYQDPPRVPFYPASRSLSSAYEYGYRSSFQGSQVSASEQSYYHQQPNQFKQYGREGSFQESSVASPICFPGETSDGKYYHCSSQSQLQDLQNHYLYEPSSAATPHRSVYSERSYQAPAAPHRYTYSELYMGNSKSESSSERSSDRDKNRYVRERNPVVKRHVLPSAGGAPFATCSYCLELLELPQVSLHNKHKRYQVRCGSCSGVLKLSTHDEADTVLDSPSFVDSGMGFTDETVAIHQCDQASASEGHEEIYPDETPMSYSDNDSGDTICKSINDVILSPSLETFEDRQRTLSEILDSQLEPLQPKLKPSVNHKFREQQPASSEAIKETSIIHLEQSQEVHSEKLTEMDTKISERGGYNFEESRYEKNEILKPEEMVGDGSGESLEVTVYRNNDMGRSSEKPETVAERPISQRVGLLNKNEYICETRLLSETTIDSQELRWKDIQENEEYGGEATWKKIMGNKTGLHLEKSQYSEDSICDSTSSNGETFEDTTVEEDTEHISNTISNAMSANPQSPLKSLVNESQRLIGHPDDSGEATVTISKIHGEQFQDCRLEQSQYKYENLSEKQELDKTISDRVRYEVEEESRYETNASEDVSGVSFEKASETFKTIEEGDTSEGRSASHQMNPPKENVEDSFETVEPVYLHGSGYAGERAWEETMGDRAGLHLEEYERNYENHNTPIKWTSGRAPTSHMHESELEEILEPEEDANGRSEFSSRGSFNDHETPEENSVFHESRDAKQEQLLYEYENSSERQELSSPDFDIVKSELQDCRYETNEMLEPYKMDGVGSDASLEKVSETIIGETGKERSAVHQIEPQNENVENSYVEPAYLEGERNASERTWAETKGDESGLQLEDHQSNSYPFGWTSERAPTFRLRDYEQGTIPELAENADGRSKSSSRSSFSDHEISKVIAVLQEESWVVNDTKTALQIREMVEDENSLHVEKRENESMKLGETFQWTSERALTFRLREDEPMTMLERDEDDDGRSESSSRSSLNDHTSSKERVMSHEEELRPVNDHETEALDVGVSAEDDHELQLEKGENGTVDLHKALEPKDDIFMLCPNDTFGQERMMFHLEMSEETQENLGQTLKQGDTEENTPASGSKLSSEGYESSKVLDSDSEEEIFEDHLEHLQKDNEKSGQTSEPYPHLHITTEPSEIVGLRHALYQTQTSPLRSPLTSPIHTPIGSPLHYLINSQTRSPITSPIHSHIVSPLRSPINSSGSLSDVLFFGNKS